MKALGYEINAYTEHHQGGLLPRTHSGIFRPRGRLFQIRPRIARAEKDARILPSEKGKLQPSARKRKGALEIARLQSNHHGV